MDDILIPIVFPDYKIAAGGTTWSNLGHAGILLILGRNAHTRYYEYGRYAPGGVVKKRVVPDCKLNHEGKMIRSSLRETLKKVSAVAGHSTRIRGAFISHASAFPGAMTYVESRLKKDAEKYGIVMNNCADFMKGALKGGGLEVPMMIDPRPNSYIEEVRDDYPRLDYDPKTDILVLEGEPAGILTD